MTKDYRIQVKVKNNYFLALMEEAGFKSVRQLCLAHHLSIQTVLGVASLKLSVINTRGKVRPVYTSLATIFECLPEDLAPPQHYGKALSKNSGNVEVSLQEMSTLLPSFMEAVPKLPDYHIEQEDFLETLSKLLDKLKPRERLIIKRRYGLDGEKVSILQDIGDDLEISKVRVHQIELKTLSRLKRIINLREEFSDLSLTEFTHD